MSKVMTVPEKIAAPAAVAAPPLDRIEAPVAPPRRGWKKPLGVLLGLLLLLAAGSYAYLSMQGHESTEDANLEAHVAQVSARVGGPVSQVLVEDNQPVKKGQLLVLLDPADYQAKVDQARANLKAAQSRARALHTRAAVTRVTSDAGLSGARSDLLMSQSNLSKAHSAVDTALGSRAAAQSRVAKAQAQVATARRNLEQTESQAEAARVEVIRANQDLARIEKLVRQDALPAQDLDHIRNTHDSAVAQANAAQGRVAAARSQVAEAQAGLSVAQQGLNQSDSQVSEAQAHVGEANAQAQSYASRVDSAQSAPAQLKASQLEAATADADVEAAQAALKQAQLNLGYTEVRAPMDGRVSKRGVEVGDYVQPGQALVAEVSVEKWVVANFKETQLTQMHPGQKATVTVDAYPGVRFAAHVDSLQPGSGSRFSMLPAENASGNWVKVVQRVPVKLKLEGPLDARYNLEPGMSVEAEVELAEPSVEVGLK